MVWVVVNYFVDDRMHDVVAAYLYLDSELLQVST